MVAPTKNFTNIPDTSIDADSPLDVTLLTQIRDSLIHLEEWLGKDYVAAQNHSHDGVNSSLVPVGSNALRNGSFEIGAGTDGWTTTPYAGGTIAVNTANAMDGVNCLAITSTVLANGGGYANTNEYIPIAAGAVQIFLALVKASVANVSCKLEVVWYNSAKAQISLSTIYSSANTPVAQTQVEAALVAPATSRFYRVLVTGGVPATGTAVGTVYFDDVFSSKIQTGSLLRLTTITATNAAWAPHAATKTIVVRCRGGGGAGGGVATATGITYAWGGEAGSVDWGMVTPVAATYAATIGAGGAGVTAAAGGTGGTTSFGAVASAVGGTGGDSVATSASNTGAKNAIGRAGEGAGGAAGANSAGGAATANSGAGGGGAEADQATQFAGGAGGSGVIDVWEFA